MAPNTRSNVYHRNPNVRPPIARAGRENLLIVSEDDHNAPVFDLSCGAGVTCLGHSNLPVKEALRDQISQLCYAHSAQFTSEATEQAADLIIQGSAYLQHNTDETIDKYEQPFRDGGVTFFSGGAEAIEAAVKMALQYLNYTAGDSRPAHIIGRRHSYHGNSMFTLALGDHPRKAMLKAAFNVEAHVGRIDAYAPALFHPGLNDDELRAHCASALKSLERELQHAKHYHRRAVVVIETIGGTTLAIAPPSVEYLLGVRRLCTIFDAVLIYDEILSANFRTGLMTAWQNYQVGIPHDLTPDIFVMGKGITAGYFPLSCVVVRKHIREAGEHDGRVWHTSTNQNHVLGCAAAVAALGEYRKCAGDVKDLENHMKKVVVPMMLSCSEIINVTGTGLLWGVHFDPIRQGLHSLIKAEMLRRNYSVYCDGGTVEGKGNMILFAPPYTVSKKDLELAGAAVVEAARASSKY